jgi:hypothetical protein
MSKNGGIDIPIWLIIILLCTATPIGVVAIIAKIFLENGGQKLLKEKLAPPKLNTPPAKPPQRADAPQYPAATALPATHRLTRCGAALRRSTPAATALHRLRRSARRRICPAI